MITVRINLRNNAVTQYSGFPFTSMCVFNGRPLGAGPHGIFTLDGETDKDVFTPRTDERRVDAWFELPISQLGSDRVKQGRRLYLGGEFSGKILIQARISGEEEQLKEYRVSPRNRKLVQHVLEVPLSYSQRSEYWQFLVKNIEGSDFSIDFIDGTFLLMVRRMGL